MTDQDFVEELAARLNLWLKKDPGRANAALHTSLAHAGYANVGHLLGQLALPQGATDPQTPMDLSTARFLTPDIDDGIIGFECLTAQEMQERALRDVQAPESRLE